MNNLKNSLAGTRARIALLAALGATLGAAFPGSSALAAAAPVSGTITVNGIVPLVGKSGPFMITGAINDAGTSPVSNGAKSVVILSKGTITVNAGNFNPKFNVDPKTCAVSGNSTNPVKIVKGTGAYRGITGKLTTTYTVHGIGSKVKGSCSQNVAPLGGYFAILATGPITIP